MLYQGRNTKGLYYVLALLLLVASLAAPKAWRRQHERAATASNHAPRTASHSHAAALGVLSEPPRPHSALPPEPEGDPHRIGEPTLVLGHPTPVLGEPTLASPIAVPPDMVVETPPAEPPTLAPLHPSVSSRVEPPPANADSTLLHRSVIVPNAPPVERRPDAMIRPKPPVAGTSSWPIPQTLLTELDSLAAHPASREWAEAVRSSVMALAAGDLLGADELQTVSKALSERLAQAPSLVPHIRNAQVESQLLRTVYAVERRLTVWRLLRAADAAHVTAAQPWRRVAFSADEGAALLAALEDYERDPSPAAGRRLQERRLRLTAVDNAASRELGSHFDTHYRNANVRLAVSGALLNHLLPQPPLVASEVDDTIQGVPTFGQRYTETKLFVRLIPDRSLLRLGLEAHGEVASNTESTSGPATFFNRGQSRFLARKLFLSDGRTLHVFPAVAEANTDTSLRGIRTDFDGLPLIGSLVQAFARSQHDQRRFSVRREVREKVTDEAREQLDQQTGARLEPLQRNLATKVHEPLVRAGLEPTPISVATDEQRITMRYRLAGKEQLAAHTPRPQAPGDSWLSLQVHESAVNNAIDNLQLDGQRFELRQLYKSVATRFNQPQLDVPDDVPEEVYVTFADQDPLRVRLIDGKALVTLRIKELHADPQIWRNLEIRAVYEPRASGVDAQLARIEAVQVSGDRLSTKSQVALKTIFSKMFTRNRQMHIFPDKLIKDPRLAHLQVTQLDLHDGWLGLALGLRVERTASKSAP